MVPQAQTTRKGPSPWRPSRLWAGGMIMAMMLTLTLLAPWVIGHDPYRHNLPNNLAAPGGDHLLGTDEFGRDGLARLAHGGRVSLAIAVTGVFLGGVVGVILGVVAGFLGGWADSAIMRWIDVLLAFPGFLLALAVAVATEPGAGGIMLAVGVFSIPGFARVSRGAVLTGKEREFVAAARALGARELHVLVRHVLPTIADPVIILSTVRLSTALLTASGLSFLGLGPQPPTPEWGAMLSAGRDYLWIAPHLVTFPGLAVALTVLGLNLLGDGLRESLDPASRRGHLQ